MVAGCRRHSIWLQAAGGIPYGCRLQEVPDEAAVLKGSGTSEQQAYQEFYGRVPRSVEVELTEELVDCCVPGETQCHAHAAMR